MDQAPDLSMNIVITGLVPVISIVGGGIQASTRGSYASRFQSRTLTARGRALTRSIATKMVG
jgi:hypothetical protein